MSLDTAVQVVVVQLHRLGGGPDVDFHEVFLLGLGSAVGAASALLQIPGLIGRIFYESVSRLHAVSLPVGTHIGIVRRVRAGLSVDNFGVLDVSHGFSLIVQIGLIPCPVRVPDGGGPIGGYGHIACRRGIFFCDGSPGLDGVDGLLDLRRVRELDLRALGGHIVEGSHLVPQLGDRDIIVGAVDHPGLFHVRRGDSLGVQVGLVVRVGNLGICGLGLILRGISVRIQIPGIIRAVGLVRVPVRVQLLQNLGIFF